MKQTQYRLRQVNIGERRRRRKRRLFLRRILTALFFIIVAAGIGIPLVFYSNEEIEVLQNGNGVVIQQASENGNGAVIQQTSENGNGTVIQQASENGNGTVIQQASENDNGTVIQQASENGNGTVAQQSSGNGSAVVSDVELQNLYSPYAILTELDSGEVLAEHNAGEQIYPASLTKIMTAVIAIEESDNLEETVTIDSAIFPALYLADASMAGFEPGEEVTLKDLLYGILLPSGAECCLTFAERISGSESSFVERMNEKAKELGMDDTHFCNSTGLHDPEHYSTVRDISVLLQYALKNAAFREAFCSASYTTGSTGQHPDGLTFYSTMFKYMDNAAVTGGEILGGKTGYTEEAGLCLASLAEVNGREYILVTAGAAGTHETAQYHILDAIDVYGQIG